MQIPGATLAAGTYMFKLADSQANRHIVQIFDKNGSKLFATLLAVPDKRMEAPDKNIVLFGERPAGSPQAIKAWWYPGDSYGDEFVYPEITGAEDRERRPSASSVDGRRGVVRPREDEGCEDRPRERERRGRRERFEHRERHAHRDRHDEGQIQHHHRHVERQGLEGWP